MSVTQTPLSNFCVKNTSNRKTPENGGTRFKSYTRIWRHLNKQKSCNPSGTRWSQRVTKLFALAVIATLNLRKLPSSKVSLTFYLQFQLKQLLKQSILNGSLEMDYGFLGYTGFCCKIIIFAVDDGVSLCVLKTD